MLRCCLSILCALALVTANSAPSFAAGEFERYLGAQYTGIDTYQRSAELTTGVYLRIPFSGGPRRSVDEARFGLTFGARLPSYDRLGGTPLLLGGPKLIDLSIGKDDLRLNGLTIIGMPTLYADEDREPKKKKRVWPWVVGGVVILFVASGIALREGLEETFDDIFCGANGCDRN